MTEQLADLAVRSSAEQILGSIPHSGVKEMLAAAERRQRRMDSELDDIESDEDLSLEGKQHRAQQAIDRHAEDIAQTYRDARARVEASAETSYMFSLYIETEWDMKWDYQREVWIDRDDYAYDASRFGVGTRSGSSEPGRNGDA
jgi:hypothetical protein